MKPSGSVRGWLAWGLSLIVGVWRIVAAESPGGSPAGSRFEPLSLVPQPQSVTLRTGSFHFSRSTRLVAVGAAASEAAFLAEALGPAFGHRPAVVSRARAGDVEFQLAPGEAEFGAEGYRLTVEPQRVIVRAATPAGLFYGGVTLRQLLPVEVFGRQRSATLAAGGAFLPCLDIRDAPRFPWRGLLLDVARHYQPPAFIERFIDLMALHKLNTLQLHLTDDQGWRLEIRKYPRLTRIGSVRAESPRRGDREHGDGTPYGPYFYTRVQIRALVAYAARRHVTLVPEIEMPGHFLAALTAYPEFSCTGGPFRVRTRWGVEPDILCVGNDAAVRLATDILGEVCDLFPGRFIHIGGDEAPRDRWKTCPKCQARMRAEGLTREAQLQTWLNRRLEQFLAGRGRRLIGWDEILEGGLTPGAAVMSWRGTEGGLAAARAGHDVVMSPTTHCYFDYAQARGPAEPEAIGGFVPLSTVYAFEPMPAGLEPDRRPHLLGAQGNVWTEYLATPAEVEYFTYPRAVALAEVVWSPAGGRTFEAFQARLAAQLRRLDRQDVRYRRLD